MNRHAPALLGLLASALPAPLTAQDQATTLLACGRSAAVVVRATVVAATDPSPEWHRLRFQTTEILKGLVDAQFDLLEPAGACCGRSLFALQPGDACLLFLQRRGAALHPLGGARGVLADDAGLVAHVRALLLATDDASRAHLLVQGLGHDHPRVAGDAAQSLAVLPSLPLDAADRALVGQRLASLAQSGSTAAAPLVDAAVRLQDAAMIDQLLPLYLATDRADQATLLQKGLARCQPSLVLDRLPLFLGQPRGELRAAELLAALPPEQASPVLRNMLRTTICPRVKLCAAEALLDAGVPAADLSPHMPVQVLQLAERRREAAGSFRSIQPRRP